ncbi:MULTISPECIES: endonuclease/exonuclease/phosphatase family protein [unclassified Shimia]|uniref:endonuclease/exonuclease/phosphatase family protein n=1 Tax=unclassified Shimia TaxID=2630038 RepID=UPI0031042DD9
MRIATYNVEWFSSLFDDNNRLVMDGGWSGRQNVTRAAQIEALGVVFTALDADAVMVVEAPDQGRKRDTVKALEHFAAAFKLRAHRAVMGFANSTQQEIALLYDPDALSPVHDPRGQEIGASGMTGAPRFDGVLRIDLDVDATEDKVVFSKPPLELAVRTAAGRNLRMIGAHLKSKAPHGARTHDEVMRISIANRRKQLAQAIWLRRRIEDDLERGDDVILMGDLNDGPGLDAFEDLFGRSSVEILLGTSGGAAMFDPHAQMALRHRLAAQPTTARFHIEREGRYLNALLDYVMISEGLQAADPRWRIWHPFEDQTCWDVQDLREALLTASDHFPVVLDIEI